MNEQIKEVNLFSVSIDIIVKIKTTAARQVAEDSATCVDK